MRFLSTILLYSSCCHCSWVKTWRATLRCSHRQHCTGVSPTGRGFFLRASWWKTTRHVRTVVGVGTKGNTVTPQEEKKHVRRKKHGFVERPMHPTQIVKGGWVGRYINLNCDCDVFRRKTSNAKFITEPLHQWEKVGDHVAIWKRSKIRMHNTLLLDTYYIVFVCLLWTMNQC